MPREGDIIPITIFPHFNSSQKRKGNARPAPALLDLAKLMPDKTKMHFVGSHMFYPNRLEFLQASGAHALMIESCPSEAELHLFQSSLVLLNAIYETKNVSLEILDVIYDLENVTWRAVNEAFHNKSRRLWHPGDQVQIWEGAFMDMLCSIHEINEANQSAVVEFGLPKLTHVEVSMEELEREFHVGDQVRVALGENKGRTGSIVKITNGIGTIVEGMAKDLIEVTPSAIFFHLLITLSRFEYYCCILRAIP